VNKSRSDKEGVMKASRDGLGIAVLLAVISVGNAAQAQIHINIPEDRQPPIYANLDGGGGGFIPHTDVWAVVFFYRPPECVPVDFNLLDFIDRSGRPFGCALLFEGHTNWRSFDDPYPADSLIQGTGAIPAWFVRWPELQAAVADGDLTVPELSSLPSLIVGVASFYQESIRNDIRGSRDANEALAALGTLSDGRVFHVELTERLHDGTHTFIHVRIDFE
jgi:hypothetical protein